MTSEEEFLDMVCDTIPKFEVKEAIEKVKEDLKNMGKSDPFKAELYGAGIAGVQMLEKELNIEPTNPKAEGKL